MDEKNIDNTSEYQTHVEEPQKKVETFDNKTVTSLGSHKKSKKVPIIIGIVAVVALIVVGLVFYFLRSNSKYMFAKSLDQWMDSFEKIVEPSTDLDSNIPDDFTMKGTGSIKVNSPYLSLLKESEEYGDIVGMIEKLNDVTFYGETKIKKSEKKGSINFSAVLKDETLFDFTYVNQNSKQYLLLKGVFEKYLELEEETDMFANQSDREKMLEDMEYVWGFMKKSFQKNIKSSYFTETGEKIEVDGKEVSTTKMTLNLDGKNGTELLSNIVSDLKSDKRANGFLVSMYPEFKDFKVESSTDKDGLYYSVYVTKGVKKIVKSSIYDDEIAINHVTGKNDVFEVVENGKVIAKATLKEEKDGFSIDIENPSDKSMIIRITGTKQGDKVVYALNVKASEEIELIGSMDLSVTTKDDVRNEQVGMSLSMKYQGNEIGTIDVNFGGDIVKGATIEEIKDSVPMSSLSEEDQNKILEFFGQMVMKLS